jgi:hypothetical protein
VWVWDVCNGCGVCVCGVCGGGCVKGVGVVCVWDDCGVFVGGCFYMCVMVPYKGRVNH